MFDSQYAFYKIAFLISLFVFVFLSDDENKQTVAKLRIYIQS